jgi:hypothetical protein
LNTICPASDSMRPVHVHSQVEGAAFNTSALGRDAFCRWRHGERARCQKMRIVTLGFGGGESHEAYATPADLPLHDGTPYRGLHVRRWGLGFVHRSRTILCHAVPNLIVTIRNFCIAVQRPSGPRNVPGRFSLIIIRSAAHTQVLGPERREGRCRAAVPARRRLGPQRVLLHRRRRRLRPHAALLHVHRRAPPPRSDACI